MLLGTYSQTSTPPYLQSLVYYEKTQCARDTRKARGFSNPSRFGFRSPEYQETRRPGLGVPRGS